MIDNGPKSSPPPSSKPPPSTEGVLRRTDGARVGLTKRVHLKLGDRELEGWALNVSRGGIRVIIEDATVAVGDELSVQVGDEGDDGSFARLGHVVWAKTEPDGTVVGVEFKGHASSNTWKAVTGGDDKK